MNFLLTLVPLLFTTCFASHYRSRDRFNKVDLRTKVDVPQRNLSLCETGWTDSGNYCYILRGEKTEDWRPWNESAYDCEALGGRLASIHSHEENVFLTITFVMKLKGFIWIGLTDQAEESNYLWQDGSLYDYENWARGEPSGDKYGNEDCIGLNYALSLGRLGDWNDGKCEEVHPYICKKSHSMPETTDSDASEEGIDAKKNPERSSTGKTTYSKVTTFENISSLLNASENIPQGVLAFIMDEQSLLVRVRKGWKYLQMRKLIPVLPPPTEISPNFEVSTDSSASKEYLEKNSFVAFMREENQQFLEKPLKEDTNDSITDPDAFLEEKSVTKDTSEPEIIEETIYDLLNGNISNNLKITEIETDLKETESRPEISDVNLKVSEIETDLKEMEIGRHLENSEK